MPSEPRASEVSSNDFSHSKVKAEASEKKICGNGADVVTCRESKKTLWKIRREVGSSNFFYSLYLNGRFSH